MSRKVSKFFVAILQYLLNPVLFISIIGPILMENNLDLLNIHNVDLSGNKEFTQLLNNKYNYALNSYNIQLFVLILSLVFTFIETARAFYNLLSNHTFDAVKGIIKNSWFTTIIVILSILLIGGFSMAFMTGGFASEKLITMYLKDNEEPLFTSIGINIPFPPLRSLLTRWRIFVITYGVIFLIWESNTLPLLKRKLKALKQE